MSITHGHHPRSGPSREYNSWWSMVQRCRYPGTPSFRYYGARGIRVCKRWQKFENFLADMGPRPKGTSLDRIDNNGDYTPANCRWATRAEQSRNSRHNRVVTARGQALCVSDWARLLGVKRSTIYNRLHKGWPPEEAIFGRAS